ncbi:transposase [Methylobacterium sp.]|uniref:transposase n=1 Tax=Methylobacterium sp. TaxID=409 RepID=UPI0017CD21D7|nr:transposase [Methylobacterium sp.]
MLARSVHDAAWALLVQFVRFKAAKAGADVVLVDPRGTSQTCPACVTIKVKTLREPLHRCSCGCTLDRDVAAAQIVHQRAFSSGRDIGRQDTSQRVAA